MNKQATRKMIGILLAICFVLSVTTAAVSATGTTKTTGKTAAKTTVKAAAKTTAKNINTNVNKNVATVTAPSTYTSGTCGNNYGCNNGNCGYGGCGYGYSSFGYPVVVPVQQFVPFFITNSTILNSSTLGFNGKTGIGSKHKTDMNRVGMAGAGLNGMNTNRWIVAWNKGLI